MFSSNLSKFYIMLLCLILTGCNHSFSIKGKGDYKLKRTPTENCKYLKQQTTQPNQDIRSQQTDYKFHPRNDYEYDSLPEPKAVYLQHDDTDKSVSKKKEKKESISKRVVYKRNKRSAAAARPSAKLEDEDEEEDEDEDEDEDEEEKTSKTLKVAKIPAKQYSKKEHKTVLKNKQKKAKALSNNARKLKPIVPINSQPTIKSPLGTKRLGKGTAAKNAKAKLYESEDEEESPDIDKKLQNLLKTYDSYQHEDLGRQTKQEVPTVSKNKENEEEDEEDDDEDSDDEESSNSSNIETYNTKNKPLPLPFQ